MALSFVAGGAKVSFQDVSIVLSRPGGKQYKPAEAFILQLDGEIDRPLQ